MSSIAVIQARMASTRLPGKILAPLAERPLLEVLLERARSARSIDEWWLATSTANSDDVTAAWGAALGLGVHRGHEEDVLSRFTEIARLRNPQWIVRMTADDPFTDGAVVDLLMEQARASTASVVGDRGADRALPLGYVPEVVQAKALLRAEDAIDPGSSHHRAHVTSVLWENGAGESFTVPSDWPRRPAWRWTVDTLEDLEMARGCFAALGDAWRTAGYLDLLQVLDSDPALAELNSRVRQKAVTEG